MKSQLCCLKHCFILQCYTICYYIVIIITLISFLLIAVTPFSSNRSAWDLVVLGSDFRLGSFGLLPSSLSRCC
ncbi:hypothetical protein EB796_002522 [Bugula neritina]|uniref:Uncharacterized protein n=1 Tax=Bugula neritina TaxID=10212 RepID=A0A7J7KLZ8_BUGNE|nr:hypothetical protein EB796_002522 [Bugula neritina]